MSFAFDVIMDFLESDDKALYGYLLQGMEFIEDNGIPSCSIQNKDGQVVLKYNKNFLTSLSRLERMAVIEHEILHVANNHSERFSKDIGVNPLYDNAVSIGTDCSLNQLIKCLPKNCITLDSVRNMREDLKCLESMREAEYYIKEIIKNNNVENKYTGCSYFDKTDEEKSLTNEDKIIFKNNIISIANSVGSIPEGIRIIINEYNKSKKISWKKLLKMSCTNYSQIYENKTWKRLNRRSDLEIKGKTFKFIPKISLGIDTSGSITAFPEILPVFLSLLNEIRNCHGNNIDVIECDCQIQKEYKLNKNTKINNNFSGGGGTSFVPVFDRCNKYYKPNILIYLTDGEGDFPINKPKYKTIWCYINNREVKFPFGRAIRIEI